MNLEIKDLYKSLETPCYILDEKKLNDNYDELVKTFTSRWGNFVVGYSFKTNSLPWVLTFMRDKGAYAEVVSNAEYRLALKLGYSKDKVIINGPCKGVEALEDTLENGAIVNLDSFHEIDWIKNNKPKKKQLWKIGLRVNFNLESYCPGETIMGEEPGRFGFNLENGSFDKAIDELKNIPYIKVVGIHGHHSTRTKSLKVFKTISEKLLDASKDIVNDIEYLDLGGCIFGDKPGAPTYQEYVDTICNVLEKVYDKNKVRLILEPGAALIASPFKYLCRAIDKKDVADSRIVSTDGSLIHIDPQMHGIQFFYESFQSGKNIVKKQILSGFTCIEKDRLAIIKNKKELNVGDYILFYNTGAYSMALSPLFIQYYPYVYIEKDEEILIAREPWNENEYIIKSLFNS